MSCFVQLVSLQSQAIIYNQDISKCQCIMQCFLTFLRQKSGKNNKYSLRQRSHKNGIILAIFQHLRWTMDSERFNIILGESELSIKIIPDTHIRYDYTGVLHDLQSE